MTDDEVRQVADTLKADLHAEVDVDRINNCGRYRFSVVSDTFEGVSQRRRQDLVWAAVDKVLGREVTLDISLILAFAPSELSQTQS